MSIELQVELPFSTCLYIEKGVVICLVSIEMTWYVVFEGRVPGVYEEWEDCQAQAAGDQLQRQLL